MIWMDTAVCEIGVKEVQGNQDNSRILEYLSTVKKGFLGGILHDEIAWCSAFVNWVMNMSGLEGTNNPAARSWLKWGKENICKVGSIVVLRRGYSWQGHVGFVSKVGEYQVRVLGGNQNNSVCESWYDKSLILGTRTPSYNL